MTDITREALEAMGFEVVSECEYGSILARRFESIAIQVELMGSVKFSFLGCWFPVNPHIRTVPDLRQLIRSLFGDDALPRRELSSITDEELKVLCFVAFGNTAKNTTIEVFRDADGEVSAQGQNGDFVASVNGETGLYIAAYDGLQVNVQPTYNYLINECDFHLPAFHGGKGGE